MVAGPIKIGMPAFAGLACPADRTTSRVKPGDQDADLIGEVKSSAAEAGGKARAVVYHSCNVAVPVEVPAGFQAALAGARFEGGYSLPGGAKAIIRTERTVVGGSGLKRQQQLAAPSSGLSGSFENELNINDVVWTSCAGGGFNLRSNMSIALSNPSKKVAATFTIGVPDSKVTELVYKVEWRRCRL